MAQNRERETLDQLKDRFGDLQDRFDQKAFPGMHQENLPSVESPQRRAEQIEAQAQDTQPAHDIWPDQAAKPDFDQAASAMTGDDRDRSVSSRQVGEDAPEHNLPPPRESDDQDRAAHAQRMAQDDARSRRGMTDEYFDRLAERMREAELDRRAYGQEQNHGQDFDQSR